MKRNQFLKFFLTKKRAFFTLGFFLFFPMQLFCQSQHDIDSLVKVYEAGNYNTEEKLKILYNLSLNHNDPEIALGYSEELIINAKQLDSLKFPFRVSAFPLFK